MSIRWIALALGGLFLTSVPMASHHSQAMYDATKEITIKGTVTRFDWRNPHSWVYLDAAEAGQTVHWEFETLSPNSLTRAGWKRSQIKSGDEVSIVGHRNKDGSPKARLLRVILADGKVLLPGKDPGQP